MSTPTNKPIRHGEVMLYPVSRVPAGKKSEATSYIVGHSETGHHHVLDSETAMEITQTDKNSLYVRLFKPGELSHKKETEAHKTLPVKVGKYKVVHKNQYNPISKRIEEVSD